MSEHRVVVTEPWHVHSIAHHATEECHRENRAVTGLSLERSLRAYVVASRAPFTWVVNGLPAAMFGVSQNTPFHDQVGYPWVVPTPLIFQHKRLFLTGSRRWVKMMLEEFPRLEAVVDSRHERAVSWMRWMGFILEGPEPYGVEKVPFYSAYMERP